MITTTGCRRCGVTVVIPQVLDARNAFSQALYATVCLFAILFEQLWDVRQLLLVFIHGTSSAGASSSFPQKVSGIHPRCCPNKASPPYRRLAACIISPCQVFLSSGLSKNRSFPLVLFDWVDVGSFGSPIPNSFYLSL